MGPFVGTVQRATFLGSVVEYEVSVEGLSPLLVQTSNPLEGRIHKVGSSVRVDFPPGTLHVLAPESRETASELAPATSNRIL
jgi:ABC-type Fe3+/spermidine/putrescine transport system ATPase subunit